jgi:L-methionine (R)-S-oxide reductase
VEAVAFAASDKASRYRELVPQLAALFEGEPDLIANLANATAAIRACVRAASWVGFYLRRPREGDELVLGPFQGNVACVRIAIGRGVCGTAARTRRTLIVPDIAEFPGHIACDAGSRSEIVVPVLHQGELVAVLDLDSYELAAFDDIDAGGLTKVAALLGELAW